jgi:hypothetical protein
MNCPKCEIEMKFISKNFFQFVNKKPIPFLVNEGDQHPISSNTYICPNCGLIQQYIPEDELKYLENL